MKYILFVFTAFVMIAVACTKGKFQTKPTISVRSVNTKLVPLNGTFIITLDCTDKEGDVQDSVIIIKQRLNRRVVPTIRDTIRYHFPVFPKSTRTQIQAVLDYQSILSALNPPVIPGSVPPQKELDTLNLRLAVRDNAGNTSDTINSPIIVVVRQ